MVCSFAVTFNYSFGCSLRNIQWTAFRKIEFQAYWRKPTISNQLSFSIWCERERERESKNLRNKNKPLSKLQFPVTKKVYLLPLKSIEIRLSATWENVCACMCMNVCVCEREREEKESSFDRKYVKKSSSVWQSLEIGFLFFRMRINFSFHFAIFFFFFEQSNSCDQSFGSLCAGSTNSCSGANFWLFSFFFRENKVRKI